MWVDTGVDAAEESSSVLTADTSATIAMELAETLSVEVTSLDPLGQTIDTDALDRLVDGIDSEFQFEFSHENCRITLTAETLEITPIADERA